MATQRYPGVCGTGLGCVHFQSLSDVPSHNRLGAVFIPQSDGGDGLVCRVLTGTPAETAGLMNGDRLQQVNDRVFQDYERSDLAALQRLFSQPAGTAKTIHVKRGESDVTLVATLRDILK